MSADIRRERILAPGCRSREHVHDGMCIGRNEVYRALGCPQFAKDSLRGRPPLVSGSSVAEVATADHADSKSLATPADEVEISPQQGTPNTLQTLPVLRSQPEPLAHEDNLAVLERASWRRAFNL